MIQRAKPLIAKQANGPLTLSGVAQQVGLSPQHFCKVFKQRVGTTFTDSGPVGPNNVSQLSQSGPFFRRRHPNTRFREPAEMGKVC